MLLRTLTVVAAAAALLAAPAPARAAGPVLLTGDSMMLVLERALAPELRAVGAEVRTDSRVGSGITKPFVFGWGALAQRQALEVRPAVTIVFLGAGDVYPLGRVRCCGSRWVAAYARKAEAMIRSWLRGGSGRVYWLTVPTPGDPRLAVINERIDGAVARAVAAAGSGAAVLDLVPLLTPGRRYRRRMPWAGRTEVVRQLDHVHLSRAGSGIAAGHIRSVLQRDGVLPPAG